MTEPVIEAVDVVKFFGKGAGRVEALKGVSLSLACGQLTLLMGPSGSGKTTLLSVLGCMLTPSAGTVRVDGTDVARGGPAEMRRVRRQMQPVFQDPYAALNPRMNVLEIVTEPLVIHRRDSGMGVGKAALRAKAIELLGDVGLDETALGRYPHEFSGGQRQRINIARALALRPHFLVLDEPVSALDVSVGAQIVNLLRGLQREHGLTYLFISHSMPLVRYLSTRIAVMEHGKLVETGEAEEICAHPREAYTRQLIAATPELPVGAGK